MAPIKDRPCYSSFQQATSYRNRMPSTQGDQLDFVWIRPDYDRQFPGYQMFLTTRLNKEAIDIASMWSFTSAEDAITRGLAFLPLHIIPTVVSIAPPDPNDPGQLICLCERIQQLVHFLQGTENPIKSLTIDPIHKSFQFSGNGEPQLNFSFPLIYFGDICLTFIQSDIEAVLTPFYRLQNVRSVRSLD